MARATLVSAGHDVVWVGDWAHDPGDEEIIAWAANETRILVTLDKDFGELAVIRREPHAGIVRLVGYRAEQQAPVLLALLTQYSAELENAAIVTVEPGRVRVRPSDG